MIYVTCISVTWFHKSFPLSLHLALEVTYPKSRPPVESWKNVQASGLLNNVARRGARALYSDGAKAWLTAARHLKIKCHQVSHQNKEFCRLLTDINSTKLSKIAGTQQIDRQWLSLKKFVFSNLHRKVKTLVGSEVNPSLRRRCFQYVWRCNLQTCTPLVMLKELAKLVKNNDADNC